MPLRLFVVPLLSPGLPDFGFAANTTNERLVYVELRQAAIRIDVF
jgi:hypothetical protein